MILPLSLTFAAACALINMWLSWRVGKLRVSEKVLHGDGGNTLIGRRMRAHSNFAEYTPIVLILFTLVEFGLGSHWGLWAVMAVYLLGRVAHAFGMDSETAAPTRQWGILSTFLVTLALVIAALYAAYGSMGRATVIDGAPVALRS